MTSAEQTRTPTAAGGIHGYRTLWATLFIGWLLAYADRSITGPVVTWMIDNEVAFMQSANEPHALGGLIGSLFFAGYMLTQLPSGRLGDRYGNSAMLTICFIWAGIATMLNGVLSGLFAFVALRVLTGLGEGAFYSNDRALIIARTPAHKRSLGLGVAITGLAFGLTVASVATPWLLNIGTALLGRGGWRFPFLFFGVITLLFGVLLSFYLRKLFGRKQVREPLGRLLGMSAVFGTLIMLLFWLTDSLGLPNWVSALAEVVLALAIVGVTQTRRRSRARQSEPAPPRAAIQWRGTVPIYLAAIAIMWSIWLFGYWSVEIVSSAADTSLVQAGLTAAFNAGAGMIGFPVGGWISDVARRRGWGRRDILIAATLAQGVLVLTFGLYLQHTTQPSLALLGVLLFGTGLFLNAVQPMSQALTADLVPEQQHATAFGMWNMIGEIGALASPVISGTVRDTTGSWAPAVYLDAALVLGSALLYLAVHRDRTPTSLDAPG